ncbi:MULTISPECIES: hypothetical protein [Chitinophagaceae]|uniref:hypothetical protein n=1 Tax=Chitinophagaceae TaxID=563835 RepID=UPI000DEF88D8|nr:MULTISPECIES: hypothetical protein [Chitinophagaceae]RPD48836.1 hypothetical protein DRJ53_09225 [Paracnuella aquatica]
MKKHLQLIMLLLCSSAVFAQQEEGKENRWFGGGNFGLSFGNYTFINISPQVGYRFTERVAAGGGVNFQYVSNRTRRGDETISKFNRGVGGLNVFGRVYPIQQFMLQVQPEANYVWGKDIYYNPRTEYKVGSQLVPSLLLGGGAVFPTGRSALIISMFYDVLQNDRSPYGRRAIVNFGYNVGF